MGSRKRAEASDILVVLSIYLVNGFVSLAQYNDLEDFEKHIFAIRGEAHELAMKGMSQCSL
jgi:hypothetical protein